MIMEGLRSNRKIELAREYVINTRANIFLTGKAGSGKTTFMREVIKQITKHTVVAAPTGVAAINAGGVTLHSLFQLPFSPFIPGVQPTSGYAPQQRLSRNKISIIRSMELLIIDEVSMVRCDMLDAVDHTLRRVRRSSQPFGGVQLLLIGDIQQLSPICHEDEWEMLRQHYTTPYFFDSLALRSSHYLTIEFDEIFRQGDTHFTNILNAVRTNSLNNEQLSELNRRYIPNFEPDDLSSDYITLTTHNHTANRINSQKLSQITTPPRLYKASVSGDFAESAYPNDYLLELKVGAQVLFIKNDISPRHRYYNGMIGVVRSMDDKSVVVEPKEGGEPIAVEAVAWESVEYKINSATGEMEQTIKGTFTQMPLKCAWAITIHKSQGLSFDRAIIDASGSFAHGQVYVALSRCRTLEGMVLRSPITHAAIIGDSLVDDYSQFVSTDQRSETSLDALKRDYYIATLCSIFDFEELQKALWDVMSVMRGAQAQAYPKLTASIIEVIGIFDKEIAQVGRSFQTQLRSLLNGEADYKESSIVKQRLLKASEYFTPRIEPILKIAERLTVVEPDAAEARRRIADGSKQIRSIVAIRLYALKLCDEGFDMVRYLKERAKSIALESLSAEAKRKTPRSDASPKTKEPAAINHEDIKHPELIRTLQLWRKAQAAEEQVAAAYMVLSNRTIMNIQYELPRSIKELGAVNGIGKVKLNKYGDHIIEIVTDYCATHNIR